MFSTITAAILLLAHATTGIAIPAPIPYPTPAPATHAARASRSGTAASTAAGSRTTTMPMGTGTGGHAPYANRTFSYTFTDSTLGFIIGCDDTTVISKSSDGISAGIWCKTQGVTITTDLGIAKSTNAMNDPNITTAYSWTHVPNAYTGPSDGCSTVTTLDTSIASTTMTYCTCGNGEMGGLALAISGQTSTTICQATATGVPSGYTQVPFGPGAPDWATPVSTGPCATPTALNSDCWKDLDIAGYANWWWEQNNKTCQPAGNFADCFFDRMTPYTGAECANLTGDAEKCKQPQWSDFEKEWNGARTFYLATTIANINAFFTQYWQAVGAASTIAGEGLQNIVTTINPDKPTNYGFNAAMAALATGLAFIPGAGGPFASAIITAAQQAPGLARFAIPIGSSEEDQILDAAKIGDELGQLTNQLQGNISLALGVAQTDVTNVVNIANSGPYAGNVPQIEDLKNQILTGLYTYVVAQSYNAAQALVTRQVDTDVNQLGTNGTKLGWTPCNTGYYANGTCGAGDFWFDKNTKISYALVDKNDPTTRFNTQMNQFLAQTTGELLFTGADECHNKYKGSGPIISFDGGQFSTPCLSNLKVCTWTMDPASPGSNGPLLSDCDVGSAIPGIGRGSCNSQPGVYTADPGDGTILPWGYLGWGMLDNLVGEHEFCEPVQASEF